MLQPIQSANSIFSRLLQSFGPAKDTQPISCWLERLNQVTQKHTVAEYVVEEMPPWVARSGDGDIEAHAV